MSKYYEALKLRAPEKYLRKTFKSHRGKKILIDEWYFRLHYKTTMRILMLFIVLVSVDQFVEKSILCDTSDFSLLKTNSLNFRKEFIETYCFIQTTFSIPAYINNSEKGAGVKRVGLDGSLNRMSGQDWASTINSSKYPEEVFYAYYQWVPFFILFLAILFFIPHYIWNHVENHRIRGMLQSIHTRDLKKTAAQQTEQIELLAKYLWKSIELRAYKWWICLYIVCEFLTIIALIINVHLTNVFVNYEFTSYGSSVILSLMQEDPEDRTDPMSFVFPRITKCTFRFFGHSQTIQTADTICLLTMNIINEKVFVFLWFWFIFLFTMTVLGLILRIASLISVKFRMLQFGIAIRRAGAPSTSEEVERLDILVEKLTICDWILLRFIQLNLDDRNFRILLQRINFHRLGQVGHRHNTMVFKKSVPLPEGGDQFSLQKVIVGPNVDASSL